MEKLTVEIPSESICLKNVICPDGHSLMDPQRVMGDVPSIKVLVSSDVDEGFLHLNAWYGNFEYQTPLELKDGAVYELLCPSCRSSLKSDETRCMFCGSPMFVLHLSGGGNLEGCCRKGCHNHKLKLVDLNAEFSQLFENDTRPRF